MAPESEKTYVVRRKVMRSEVRVPTVMITRSKIQTANLYVNRKVDLIHGSDGQL